MQRYGEREMKKKRELIRWATRKKKELANGYDPNIAPETNDSIFCTQTP